MKTLLIIGMVMLSSVAFGQRDTTYNDNKVVVIVKPVQADTVPVIMLAAHRGGYVTLLRGYRIFDYKTLETYFLDENLLTLKDWIIWDFKVE